MPSANSHSRGRLFWPALLVGWVVMALGVRGLLVDAADTQPFDFARWFVGSALVHDLVLAPVVLAVGAVLTRLVPSGTRPYLQAVLIVTGLVAVVAFPFVLSLGRPDDPSALPGNYPAGLAVVLAVVWSIVAAQLVVFRTRGREQPGGSRERLRPPKTER